MFHIGLISAKPRFALLTICLLIVMLLVSQSGFTAAPENDTAALEDGFRHMYNLDFAGAHKTFEAWQEEHPEDPLGAAANAAVYLFGEFERMHILELDLFTNNKKFEQQKGISPDPALKKVFDQELQKADDLAKKVLSETPEHPDALFARVLTDGLRGDYAALIDKKTGPGLSYLKSSRSTAEKLLKIDPEYHDAYLALGIENYVLGVKSAPTRWMLRLSGAQTNKEKGIASLRITAEKGRYLAPYARLLLAIAALRDQDKKTAKKILADLSKEFPQNHLYQIELNHLS
jgi:hypothetical protein